MYRKQGLFFVQWQLPVHLALNAHHPTLPVFIVNNYNGFFKFLTRYVTLAIQLSAIFQVDDKGAFFLENENEACGIVLPKRAQFPEVFTCSSSWNCDTIKKEYNNLEAKE